jgi:hypothetical protein
MDEVSRLLTLQDGVVSRRQALTAGLAPHDIRRLLRRREWAPVHPGVFVDHTGPLTWRQRAWAAVLFAWPAALCGASALRADDGPGRRDRVDEHGPIHVAVDRDRSVRPPAEVVVHRLADLDGKARWNLSPPRLRVEEALLDVAAAARDEFRAIAVLADAVQARRTTAPRIRSALDGRTRIARRRFLADVLTDIAEGACSTLEQGYLTRVERAHGLPPALRQALVRNPSGTVLRDVDYEEFGLLVELDGRLFHDSAAARHRDLGRDLDSAVAGGTTVRLGWGQVFDTACHSAARIGRLLNQRGWTGHLRRCPRCPIEDSGDLEPPGGTAPPLSA